MAKRSPTLLPAPVRLTFVSRCRSCGRVESFSVADLLRYRREGWPVCCGQRTRCYFAGQEQTEERGRTRPAPDETSWA